MLLQFIDKRSAGFLDLKCIGARHAVHAFSEGRDGDLKLSKGPRS
jgi:hypothetical protein